MPVSISTHVLDTALGRPAEAVRTTLESLEPKGLQLDATTGKDGRIHFPSGQLPSGTYRLRFDTEGYFAKQKSSTLYPYIEITFAVTEGHYHIPLLLTPYGYSTYRGS
ncbi:5-hydroxyisourate hydrolase [Eumeta japonica]|uniref:5-hydroxyisourate hydrolase n=1 Tax=Eumeta variegata TaxID=151549 RepID=A0A4C1XKU5_EUMVA|nr:5-hydroxyisourate hydrolase [Eumeta japonica]